MVWPISIATPYDETELVSLLRLKHMEDGGMASFDDARVRATLRRGIDRQMAIIGVIRGPVAIEASIGLYISGWWYSDQSHLSDLWNFVAPAYRRSAHAKTLLEFAKWVAGMLDKPLLMHEVLNDKTINKIKLMERQLGKQDGVMFLCEPSQAQLPLDGARVAL